MVSLIFILLWVMIVLTAVAIAMVLKGDNTDYSAARHKEVAHSQKPSPLKA